MNVDASYLSRIGDLIIACLIVFVSIFVYFFESIWWLDQTYTIVGTVISMVLTYPTIKQSIYILMEGAPGQLDVE